jgi:hypothetical protein
MGEAIEADSLPQDQDPFPEDTAGPRYSARAVSQTVRNPGGKPCIGILPRLSLIAAAEFATLVDAARSRAASEGRTLVYTIHLG